MIQEISNIKDFEYGIKDIIEILQNIKNINYKEDYPVDFGEYIQESIKKRIFNIIDQPKDYLDGFFSTLDDVVNSSCTGCNINIWKHVMKGILSKAIKVYSHNNIKLSEIANKLGYRIDESIYDEILELREYFRDAFTGCFCEYFYLDLLITDSKYHKKIH